MRKIKDVLRLHFEAGLQRRLIARAVGTSHTIVGDYLKRAARAGLSWHPTHVSTLGRQKIGRIDGFG